MTELVERGFVTLKARLVAAELDALRKFAAARLAAESPAARARVRSNGSMINLARHPDSAGIISSPVILNALRETGARNIRWTGGYLISKPPGGPPLFWHQDWWAWNDDFSYRAAPAQLFVMIYLVDTGLENGCLRVIPHTHRRRHRLHDIMEAHAADLAAVADPTDAAFCSDPDEIDVPVRAGDLVIGDARLLHGARANESKDERPLLTLWYAPNYRELPENIRAFYARQMREQDGDVAETGGVGVKSPYDWPPKAYEQVAALLPGYDGDAAPVQWRRTPDLARLLP